MPAVWRSRASCGYNCYADSRPADSVKAEMQTPALAPQHRRNVAQRIEERIGARQTSQGEGLLGPGHGHVVEPTRSIDVLGLPNAIPAAVQHHHVVELQAPGAVGGVQEQSQLLAAYLTPPRRRVSSLTGSRSRPLPAPWPGPGRRYPRNGGRKTACKRIRIVAYLSTLILLLIPPYPSSGRIVVTLRANRYVLSQVGVLAV